jgi:hypothetical protein
VSRAAITEAIQEGRLSRCLGDRGGRKMISDVELGRRGMAPEHA